MLRVASYALKPVQSAIVGTQRLTVADKGDTVVVLDSEHYFGLAAKLLVDSETYELLDTDPSAEIVLRYHQYLERCVDDKILDDYQYRCLKVPSDYQLPTIYFLPKIHKHPLKLRPIVASFKVLRQMLRDT